MRFAIQTSACLAAISSFLLIPSTYARPTASPFSSYDYGVERSTILKRQTPGTFAVTGVQSNGTAGSVPVRREIRELEQDPAMWTLYLLGLDAMQYMPSTDLLSWYQVSGIHGRPFLPWDNSQPTPGDEGNGYCTHISILFPPWHRPYLAIYEQVLWDLIQQIAQQYPAGPTRDNYTATAANFRIPYWDWAATPASGESVFPNSVWKSDSVVVDGPAGKQEIANPLYSFRFNPLSPSDLPDAPFNIFPTTLRYPTTQDASAVSQNNLVAQQLDNSASSFRGRLYNLFSNYKNYTTFSNEAWFDSNNNPNNYDSIESIHDAIHGLVGNGGHMGVIDYSAFDPVFWLHHTMVDRVFAMWQALNPDSYVTPQTAKYSTYTMTAGQIQDVNTPLAPFPKDTSGTFWTSAEVQSTETFGYAYEETALNAGGNLQNQVSAAVAALYGPQPSKGTVAAARSLPAPTEEWIANIEVEKYALNTTFFIHVFLGSFTDEPSTWSFEPDLVGTHTIFVKGQSAIAGSTCSACDPNQVVTATIPLTEAIQNAVTAGKVKSMSDADVDAYLATNLKYRITLTDDSEVSNTDPRLQSLKISVVSANIQPSVNGALPQWGPMKAVMTVGTS